ncbi:hypothetical protein EV129_105183 [Rhizobium azibense]|uniref:Uncharacterized protein n=1 Tax=Rhizobium azibense TaxID=1136135 RepID=A0A4R3RSW3_9HYPH|nr:hypothetical protein EV129_105183 [Rhizobium azibense]
MEAVNFSIGRFISLAPKACLPPVSALRSAIAQRMAPAQRPITYWIVGVKGIRHSLAHWPVEARGKARYGFASRNRVTQIDACYFRHLLKVETI